MGTVTYIEGINKFKKWYSHIDKATNPEFELYRESINKMVKNSLKDKDENQVYNFLSTPEVIYEICNEYKKQSEYWNKLGGESFRKRFEEGELTSGIAQCLILAY